jgi:hypothetical protein
MARPYAISLNRSLRGTTLALFAMITFGCAGSSSETPWPPEPADVDLGPAGEARTDEAVRAATSASAAVPSAPTFGR